MNFSSFLASTILFVSLSEMMSVILPCNQDKQPKGFTKIRLDVLTIFSAGSVLPPFPSLACTEISISNVALKSSLSCYLQISLGFYHYHHFKVNL